MIVLLFLMNLRDNERNLCCVKKHEDQIAGEGFYCYDTLPFGAYLVHKFIRCHKR